MTKGDILKAIRNHSSEIKKANIALEFHLLSIVNEYRPEVEGDIDALKGLADFIKNKADDIKAILGDWPE